MPTAKHSRIAIYLSLFMLTSTIPAEANAGIPMIFVTLPTMVAALVPVIIIESLIYCRQMNSPFWPMVRITSAANFASTLFGIPVTWIVLVMLQMVTGGGSSFGLQTVMQRFLAVTWQAAWLIPYEKDLYWMIPTAMLVLLVPYFFVSWLIEYRVIKWLAMSQSTNPSIRSVLIANLVSYALLALVVFGWLLIAQARSRVNL